MIIKVCLPFYSEFERAKPGLAELNACTEHEFIICPAQGTYIFELRNRFINDGKSQNKKQKLIEGFDAFLDIDSDISFTLDQVLSMIARKKDIVHLPYLIHRSDEIFQCGTFREPGIINAKYSTADKGFKKVDWAGNGMRLTMAHVYEAMEYPWYRHPMIITGESQREAGEDIGFCMGATKAGFDLWCDFDNPVGHKSRNQSQFNWEIPMADTPQPQIRLKEDMSATVLSITKILTMMSEEHAKAVQEIKLCHTLIASQKETIKTFEEEAAKKEKIPAKA